MRRKSGVFNGKLTGGTSEHARQFPMKDGFMKERVMKGEKATRGKKKRRRRKLTRR